VKPEIGSENEVKRVIELIKENAAKSKDEMKKVWTGYRKIRKAYKKAWTMYKKVKFK